MTIWHYTNLITFNLKCYARIGKGRGGSPQNFVVPDEHKNLEWWDYIAKKKSDDIFSHFDKYTSISIDGEKTPVNGVDLCMHSVMPQKNVEQSADVVPCNSQKLSCKRLTWFYSTKPSLTTEHSYQHWSQYSFRFECAIQIKFKQSVANSCIFDYKLF